MNSRAPDHSIRTLLARHYGALRRALIARQALKAAALSALAIAVGVALGTFVPLGPGFAWTRLVLLALAFTAAVTLAVRAFLRALPAFEGYLERVENRFPDVRSWLRNALDLEAHPPAHASKELTGALGRETARRLEQVPLDSLRPSVEPRRPALALGGAFALLMILALVTPARLGRSWATLWNPAAAAPAVRLEVEPGSVRITPGAALAVRARVWGTAQRPRLVLDRNTRVAATAEGEAGGARLWRFDLTQLTRPTDYRVRVATVESPRYTIALAGEPQPVSFEIEYRAPAYARLPLQRGAATRGDLSALRGTRARVEVTFDRDLESLDAAWPGGEGRWTAITPRRWRGEVPIERDGEYALHARSAGGESRFRYRVSPLADAPPVLAVRTPEGDLDLPSGQLVPLEVLGQDDLGLSELRLQVRKDSAAPWATLSLARFPGAPREAQVTRRWDVSGLGLLPGESASFRFELYDDNAVSGRGVATSPTFQLRFPSLADLYQQLDQRRDVVQSTLEKVAEQAKEQQKALDKLARQPQPSPNQPFQPSPATARSFERQEELKNALERQQDLAKKIEDASQQLQENLDQAAERKAFDEQLQAKLQEMARLMQQVQSKEFKEALKKMQEALEQLDKKALEQNLPKWQQENKDLLKNLERTVELLKQLHEEERLQALAQRAQELKALQDQLNQRMQDPPRSSQAAKDAESKSQAAQQQKAAEETSKLAEDTHAASKESAEQKDQESLEKAAQELSEEASPAQQEAAAAAAKQQQSNASKSGQRAAQSLQKAADQLSAMSAQKREQENSADLAALRRAAQDLVSLQRESEGNLTSSAPPADRADRQTDLSEGTSRVADSLYQLAKKSPFITPKLGVSLGRAIEQLSNSGKEMGQGNRARGEEQGRSASQLLNQAVLELRKIENSMCNQPGGQQPGGVAPRKPGQQGPPQSGTSEQMGQLGKEQSRLNQQSRSLAQRMSQAMGLSTGDRQELQRLSHEQQRIREQLEQVQRDEDVKKQLLGRLDQAQQEMKEVEEAMRSGATDGPLEEKQQRILSRLLDAQRSVNRRDFDPERESRAGEDVIRASPTALPADLMREQDRLRLDLLKAEADRYPAQYRAFIETYLRSLNGSRR
jgi:hypothetical protein